MRLEFREPRDDREFNEVHEVRIRSYRESILSGFLEDVKGLCMHDSISFHYGLFEVKAMRAVGCLRLTPYTEAMNSTLQSGSIQFDYSGFMSPEPKVITMPRPVPEGGFWGESTGTWG